MTISIKQSLNVIKTYGSLGSISDAENTEVEVSYTASRLIDFDGNQVTAEFSVEISGQTTGQPYRLSYQYSGSGNPLDEAESALSKYLS